MSHNRFATWGKVLVLTGILLSTWSSSLAQSASELTAHFVEVIPGNDGISYQVNIYLSVLDSGKPVNELKQEALAVQEDGLKVDIQSLSPLTEEPLNIVLVMDTSASMSETDIKNAKDAASTFISRLKPDDQIAFITFDSSAKNQVDELTNDHQKIIDIINNKTFATRESGTCLYDAAYSALRLFTPQPEGSRAVILITNGKDEKTIGVRCSDHTSDEIIAMASEGDLRAPLYVIGVQVDEKSDEGVKNLEVLQNFAKQTGGLYINHTSSSKLANTFDALSTQFRGQYILTYTSTSLPGAHHVIVSLNDPNRSDPLDSDTRKFSLPILPPHIAFTSPLEGENVIDVLKIAVTLTTQGEAVVERVAFEVNGSIEGEDDTKPYEIELDAKKYPAGLMTISVTAYGANNTELARSSINVIRADATEMEQAVPVLEVTQPPETPLPSDGTPASNNSMVVMAVVLSGLSIVAIGALIFFLLRQQKQATLRDLEDFIDGDNPLPQMQGIPMYARADESRNASDAEVPPDVLGVLTVEASDDETLLGHSVEITTPLVTLGRSADNDIVFPEDKPVSRHHAEIYQISGNLYLREVDTVDASGTARPPKYGTYLNKKPMGPDPAQLKTGDEIQLGKRVRLKFESFTHDINGDALTYDDEDLTGADDIDQTLAQD